MVVSIKNLCYRPCQGHEMDKQLSCSTVNGIVASCNITNNNAEETNREFRTSLKQYNTLSLRTDSKKR